MYIVVVGTRRNKSKWCSVKTLSEEIKESNFFKFFLDTKGLDISEEPSWINYIKGAIKSYKVKREFIPGFNAVIVSSVPIKVGLGSSTALTIAIYTFLEAITSFYTINNFEKALACHLAEKLATKKSNFIGEALSSVIGCDKKLLEIDTQILEVKEHKWIPEDIEWIFIQLPNKTEALPYQKYLVEHREITFATNTTSLRDLTIEDVSKLEPFFPESYINEIKHIINENERVTRIVNCIKINSWKKLGKIIWESYYSLRNTTTHHYSEVESIMKIIKTIPGVLGAKVAGYTFFGRILVLIRKDATKKIIQALEEISSSEYYVLRPASGVKILYADDKVHLKMRTSSEHAKIAAKYHLNDYNKDTFKTYHTRHE